MIINTIPDLHIQYDEPLGLLRVEWAAGSTMGSLRASAALLLHLERKMGVRNMLLNMDSFPDIPVYDQNWLGTNWMPDAARVPLERLVVVNHCRRVHNQMAIDSLLAQQRLALGFDIQFFPTIASGLTWLTDYSERLPRLLAEWEAAYGSGQPTPGVAEPLAQYVSRRS